MATQLIKHLENCAQTDAAFKPLLAQWAFDEPLITKALQNVGTWFPHYSRHDESHSRQILTHIERLLGKDNISDLSATNTWLLLEAAYLHDIGMVIPYEHIDKDFPEFKKHLENRRLTAIGDLLVIIDALLKNDAKPINSIFSKIYFSPIYTLKLIKELLADFYRNKHADRAKNIISEPLEIGLNSPRTELIPSRLFSLLGKICAFHGKDFKAVIQLPQQQVGMGTDDCNPRFIACLLRLGDLLDLDNNRFCPVMMKMAGDLPETSKAHYDKHLAVHSFRADQQLIEIEAECQSYESYIITTQWFGWLRDEVKNQMSRWFEIVPSPKFGLLPSVGNLKVHLNNWQVFSENQRPQFNLDRDRVLELLKGSGLYSRKEQAMRELLQNSVDATLIRIWKEYKKDEYKSTLSLIKEEEPRSDKIDKIFNNFSIRIEIEKDHEDEQFNYWNITITDQGTGISRQDLSFIANIGSSTKNIAKNETTKEMPAWMRPSGIFGIGLQSVFLLTTEVIVKTRSIDTGETLEIKLTNPTGTEKGNIYFRPIESWSFNEYGSQLTFKYKSDKNSCSVRLAGSYASQALRNHDDLLDTEQDFNILNICEEIQEFFDISFISGNLCFKDLCLNEKFLSRTIDESNNNYYSIDNNLELIAISFTYNTSRLQYYYRGQPLDEHSSLGFKYLFCSVNLVDEKADQILTINRNKFKNNSWTTLFERISNTVQSFFNCQKGEHYYRTLDEPQKAIVAAEYELQNWKCPEYFSVNWNKFSLNIFTNGTKSQIEINSLDTYENLVIYSDRSPYIQNNKHPSQARNILDEITNEFRKEKFLIINESDITSALYLVQKFLKETDFYPEYFIYKEDWLSGIKLSKNKTSPLSHENIKWYCEEILLKGQSSLWWEKRELIPCLPDFDTLAIKPSLQRQKRVFELDLISPRMLFPLANINHKITVGDLDKLVERVSQNLLTKNISSDKIREKYQEFIRLIDNLMADNVEWSRLRDD